MRRVMKSFWTVCSLFVPAFDFICDHGCFLQGKPVQQRPDLRRRRRVRQSLVCNCTDDFMPERCVRQQWRRKSDCEKSCRHKEVARCGAHFEIGDNTIESRLAQRNPPMSRSMSWAAKLNTCEQA